MSSQYQITKTQSFNIGMTYGSSLITSVNGFLLICLTFSIFGSKKEFRVQQLFLLAEFCMIVYSSIMSVPTVPMTREKYIFSNICGYTYLFLLELYPLLRMGSFNKRIKFFYFFAILFSYLNNVITGCFQYFGVNPGFVVFLEVVAVDIIVTISLFVPFIVIIIKISKQPRYLDEKTKRLRSLILVFIPIQTVFAISGFLTMFITNDVTVTEISINFGTFGLVFLEFLILLNKSTPAIIINFTAIAFKSVRVFSV